MARVKRGVTTHARHKKVLGCPKVIAGAHRHKLPHRVERLEKALRYAYRDRRIKSVIFAVSGFSVSMRRRGAWL